MKTLTFWGKHLGLYVKYQLSVVNSEVISCMTKLCTLLNTSNIHIHMSSVLFLPRMIYTFQTGTEVYACDSHYYAGKTYQVLGYVCDISSICGVSLWQIISKAIHA